MSNDIFCCCKSQFHGRMMTLTRLHRTSAILCIVGKLTDSSFWSFLSFSLEKHLKGYLLTKIGKGEISDTFLYKMVSQTFQLIWYLKIHGQTMQIIHSPDNKLKGKGFFCPVKEHSIFYAQQSAHRLTTPHKKFIAKEQRKKPGH